MHAGGSEFGTRDASARRAWSQERPDHFSTYAPRGLIRQLKVVAAIHDIPLWAVVTRALERYLQAYEEEHGALPSPTGPLSSLDEKG